MYVFDFGRSAWPIDHRHPVVAPPVGEQSRIVEAENIDVRPVHEVVRQYCLLAAAVVRTDDADTWRTVAVEDRGERLGPTAGHHSATDECPEQQYCCGHI